jgi:opacity protein-like surface antigen
LSDASNQPAARFAEPDRKDDVMRGFTTLAAAGAVTFTVAAAQAADLGVPFVPAPPVLEFSGWYLRGNIGMTNQQIEQLTNVVAPGTTVDTKFLTFDSSPFAGLGIGYQVNQWLRFDGTGEYRAGAHFHGSQVAKFGSIILPDDYHATKSEWLFLANAYVDLSTWWSVTPFIGAGIGETRNTISSFVDSGATQANGITILSTTYGGEASQWNFAWALYAGLGYKVNPALTLEFAYRYLNLGDARTGRTNSFDGVTVVNGTPFIFHDLTSNDFSFGMRWMLGEPLAPLPPPPLVRKG